MQEKVTLQSINSDEINKITHVRQDSRKTVDGCNQCHFRQKWQSDWFPKYRPNTFDKVVVLYWFPTNKALTFNQFSIPKDNKGKNVIVSIMATQKKN